jgi:hypothetical protein
MTQRRSAVRLDEIIEAARLVPRQQVARLGWEMLLTYRWFA